MIEWHDDFHQFLVNNYERSLILHVLNATRNHMTLADGKNYLNILDDGTISYLPANIGAYDPYIQRGRMKGRPARIMRSLIPDTLLPLFNDTDFEDFANLVKAHANRNQATFDLVPATDIPYWYHEDQYERSIATGSLYSCMRYEHCQPWLEMYASLGDAISLLILRKDDTQKLIGRALVWHAPDGNTYMDRAYGTDATRTRFATYAREQGWWKRATDSYDECRTFIDPEGDHQNITITIPLETFPDQGFPFMDTMQYLNAKTHTLTNYSRGTHVTLTNTDGSFATRDPYHDANVQRESTKYDTLRNIWNDTPVQPALTYSMEAANDDLF